MPAFELQFFLLVNISILLGLTINPNFILYQKYLDENFPYFHEFSVSQDDLNFTGKNAMSVKIASNGRSRVEDEHGFDENFELAKLSEIMLVERNHDFQRARNPQNASSSTFSTQTRVSLDLNKAKCAH